MQTQEPMQIIITTEETKEMEIMTEKQTENKKMIKTITNNKNRGNITIIEITQKNNKTQMETIMVNKTATPWYLNRC